VLGALHNHLNTVTFLCHFSYNLEWGRECTSFFILIKQKYHVFYLTSAQTAHRVQKYNCFTIT
jgi:hypothetical protein